MDELIVFFPLLLVFLVKILGLFVESRNFCISFGCLFSLLGVSCFESACSFIVSMLMLGNCKSSEQVVSWDVCVCSVFGRTDCVWCVVGVSFAC